MPFWGVFALGLIVLSVVVLWHLTRRPARTDSDAQIIDRLEKTGSDLTRAHAIEFLFYFPSGASADAASTRLRADGYDVSLQEIATGARWVLVATRSMVPLLPELQALRSKFDELAGREGGLYDNWKLAGPGRVGKG